MTTPARTFATPEQARAYFAAYDAVLTRWPVPVEPIEVPTPYGSTRVNVCGRTGGAPLVLLAGGGATSTVWFGNAGALSRTHRVYAVDIMGDAGCSVHSGQSMRTAGDLLSWLDAVLIHCGLDSTALCGHSYGGWLALSYALHQPARVSRLALLDPTTSFAGWNPNYLLHAAPLLLGRSGERMRRLLHWESRGAALDPCWLDLVSLGTQDFPASGVVMPRRPTPAQLRGLTAPTLVVLAGLSRAHKVSTVATNARRLVPDIRIAVLPKATHHTLPTVDPGELNRHLTAFLTE